MTSPSKRVRLGVKMCNLHGAIMVHIAHFHSKLRTPKRALFLAEVIIYYILKMNTLRVSANVRKPVIYTFQTKRVKLIHEIT